MKLVDNWQTSWRWISMQTSAAVMVLNTTALAFPPTWAPYIQASSAILGGLTMYGRLVSQEKTDDAAQAPQQP